MSEKTFRTILFVALILVAPALLFMVQVFFLVPTVFLLAGTLLMTVKSLTSGFDSENLAFLAFFAVHFLLFGGIYWLLAFAMARLASLFPSATARRTLLGLLLLGLSVLSQAPVYGGGGHGPLRMGPLQFVLKEMGGSYGQGAVWGVYLVALATVLLPFAMHRR